MKKQYGITLFLLPAKSLRILCLGGERVLWSVGDIKIGEVTPPPPLR